MYIWHVLYSCMEEVVPWVEITKVHIPSNSLIANKHKLNFKKNYNCVLLSWFSLICDTAGIPSLIFEPITTVTEPS